MNSVSQAHHVNSLVPLTVIVCGVGSRSSPPKATTRPAASRRVPPVLQDLARRTAELDPADCQGYCDIIQTPSRQQGGLAGSGREVGLATR